MAGIISRQTDVTPHGGSCVESGLTGGGVIGGGLTDERAIGGRMPVLVQSRRLEEEAPRKGQVAPLKVGTPVGT